jgi:hypothetical protein
MNPADMGQLLQLAQRHPAWHWTVVRGRAIAASDGAVIRLFALPTLLLLDEFRAQLFIRELNRERVKWGE